jgi:hypothetical protein
MPPLTCHQFPQALDEQMIPPSSTHIHAEGTPPILDGVHELLRGELATLVAFTISVLPWRLSASCRTSTVWQASSAIATLAANTWRLA